MVTRGLPSKMRINLILIPIDIAQISMNYHLYFSQMDIAYFLSEIIAGKVFLQPILQKR